MFMNARDNLRLAFRDRFRSFHNEAFQSWFEEIACVLHSAGDFQRVHKTSGDGGFDGYVINSQLVYQVYAPARMNELRDAETKTKIITDFAKVYSCLGGDLKSWVFVHNHPQASLGQKSIVAINDLKKKHPEIRIDVLDIDGLWEKLKDVPNEALAKILNLEIPMADLEMVDRVNRLDSRSPHSRLSPLELHERVNFPTEITETDLFVGREHALEILHQKLTSRKHADLTGTPGCGKTYTALRYAFQHKEDYTALFWINAATIHSLHLAFDTIAERLNVPRVDENGSNLDDHGRIYSVVNVLRWLVEHPGWLCIFDNADNPSILGPYRPNPDCGALIITARSEAFVEDEDHVVLDRMEPMEGAELLLRRAGRLKSGQQFNSVSRTDQAAALRIHADFDGLALALDQAGAYMKAASVPPDAYHARYQAEKETFLNERGANTTGHPDSVLYTYFLAFTLVEANAEIGPAAMDLLRICAFLAPDNIPEEIFRSGTEYFEGALAAAVDIPSAWDKIITVARTLALLHRDGDKKVLFIHRITQDTLQCLMSEQEKERWAFRVSHALNIAFPSNYTEDLATCERLLSHTLECRMHNRYWNIKTASIARLYDVVAGYLLERFQYEQATSLYQEALEISRQVGSVEDRDSIMTLINLGRCYFIQGDYKKAGPMYEEGLRLFRKILPRNHPDIAALLINTALLYKSQAKYRQAEKLYHEALKTCRQSLPESRNNLARCLNNLGALYDSEGQHAKAIPYLEEALQIARSLPDADEILIARGLANLANTYRRKGNSHSTLPLFEQALTLFRRIRPDGDRVFAQCLINMGVFYRDRSDLIKAEEYLTEALEMCMMILPVGDRITAECLHQLATIFAARSQFDEAERLSYEAVTMFTSALGPKHPSTLEAAMRLSFYLLEGNKLSEAERIVQRYELLT
jgi:tetratricopeptide (TPR) repeat protein